VRHRPSGLSLGAAPVLAVGTFSTTRARNLDRTDELIDSAGNLKEGRVYFDGKDVRPMFNVGARWDVSPRYAVAATWHHAPTFGLKGDLQVAFGTQPPSSTRGLLELPIADTVRFGAELRPIPALAFRPSVEWALWSVMKENVFRSAADGSTLLLIPRDFHDSVAGRLRVDYRVNFRLRLSLGFGYEHGPTPSTTYEPGLAEADSIELGAGAHVVVSRHVALRASFVWNYFFKKTITQSVQEPTTNGTYTDQRQFLTLDLEVRGWNAPDAP
jgi:long-subunit fatty acid transport protein